MAQGWVKERGCCEGHKECWAEERYRNECICEKNAVPVGQACGDRTERPLANNAGARMGMVFERGRALLCYILEHASRFRESELSKVFVADPAGRGQDARVADGPMGPPTGCRHPATHCPFPACCRRRTSQRDVPGLTCQRTITAGRRSVACDRETPGICCTTFGTRHTVENMLRVLARVPAIPTTICTSTEGGLLQQ